MKSKNAEIYRRYLLYERDLDLDFIDGEINTLLIIEGNKRKRYPNTIIEFHENDKDICIYATNFVDEVPNNKKMEMLVLLNSLNIKYGRTKFLLAEDNNIIISLQLNVQDTFYPETLEFNISIVLEAVSAELSKMMSIIWS